MRLACFLMCVAFFACNSSSDCVTAGNGLCHRAAVCADGGKARFVLVGDGGSSGDITFGSESQCDAVYAVGCQSGQDAGLIDYVSCSQAAVAAPCESSSNGGGVVVPSVCLQ